MNKQTWAIITTSKARASDIMQKIVRFRGVPIEARSETKVLFTDGVLLRYTPPTSQYRGGYHDVMIIDENVDRFDLIQNLIPYYKGDPRNTIWLSRWLECGSLKGCFE